MSVGSALDECETNSPFRELVGKAWDPIADRADCRRESHHFGELLRAGPRADARGGVVGVGQHCGTSVVGPGPRDAVGQNRVQSLDAIFAQVDYLSGVPARRDNMSDP